MRKQIKNKKMKEEQLQESMISDFEKCKEFIERVYKMSDEEFMNTEIPDYVYESNPPFIIIEMSRRGIIKGPIL